ncbi:MAG: GntR family transcriptional regulator [Proteobacteria bacterium]|nr:GntR family transcriptional regulator [Pseudomonadota bacterium]
MRVSIIHMTKSRKKTSDSILSPFDKGSYEPAYSQIANILKQHIRTGVFRPGDQLPAESELCRQYQVSPMTVRRAINMLVDQQVATAIRGSGTYVNKPEIGAANFHLQELQDFFSGSDISIKLLNVNIVKANEKIAAMLNTTVGEKTIHIRRLLKKELQPAFYHCEYLIYDPKLPTVETEMEMTSLRELFEGSGSNMIKRGAIVIKAALLTDEEAAILKVKTPMAAFYLEHTFYDFNDAPISWGYFVCPGDRLNFKTDVGIV